MNTGSLRIENMVKSFPGVMALKGVNIEVKRGRIAGLIGVNGAGKSTLMNILGGIYIPDEGGIYFNDEELILSNPRDAEKKGIGFIHQEPLMFSSMTVAENIFISKMKKKKSGRLDYKEMYSKSIEILKLMDCDISPTEKVENLAIGDQQMVEIARAVYLGGNILLFDEPTSSLSIKEKDKLFSVMRELNKQNKIIFFISHFLDEVEEICDDIIVLRDGLVSAFGEKKDFNKKKIVRYMIGKDVIKGSRIRQRGDSEVVFKVESIKGGKAPDDVSFELKKGEIVGLWGLLGSGRTELIRAMVGLDPVESGKAYLKADNKDLKSIPFNKVLNHCSYVTEDRHKDGLFLPWTVMMNISAVRLKDFTSKYLKIINSKLERESTQKFVDELNIVAPSLTTKTEQLSGGNQQKLVMAKWLMKQPEVFFLDEPTRGVDVGSKAEIHRMILQMAENGTASLVVSSEIDELSHLCDRVLVMNHGKIVAEVLKDDVSKETLMTHCV